jgi:predicted cytidylate kinase
VSRPVLWLTGPPGSGKTTAGRQAAAVLGLPYKSAGELFRAEAGRRGMELLDFSTYAELHPEIDRALDERLIEEAEPGIVLEGRVVGALLRRRLRPVYAVLVTAREEIRAVRLAGRDTAELGIARDRMRARSASERGRYRAQYGIDLDLEPMDAVLDTSELPKEAASERLVEIFRRGLEVP